jgi:hypothetical protein
LVRTISTLTPFVNMGVMTMKMMSITSITSTMGVTLISATGGGAECFIINDIANSLINPLRAWTLLFAWPFTGHGRSSARPKLTAER